ncbi:MAG: conserved membrane protein of unknown function [Candidatus Thorarchaeota archaeon]|nr:MAG: conserved membrane protein of unknown function [Candidatus Thorarchaeota archaeon]
MYEKLCRFSRRIPLLETLGERYDNRDLDKAVIFVQPLMKISAVGVVSAAYFSGLLAFILLFVVLFYLGSSILVLVPLSLIIGIIAYYVTVSYPVNLMNHYKLTLSEESDLLFEQFILVFESGGTIFDAIEIIAQSDHEYMSSAFQEILWKIDQGVPPEECLSEFAKNQPSDDLRRYIMAILSALEKKTDLLEMLSGESFEADLTLRQKNLELESRLLIVAALITYVPIMFTLAASLAGWATNPAIFIVVPLFVLLNVFLRSRFSTQFSAYFDRPRNKEVTGPTQKEILEEYDEFLNFMMLLGERMSTGDTLEVALPEVRDDVDTEVQRLIDEAIHSLYWKEEDLHTAMREAADNALGERVSNMIMMITRMAEVSSSDAGERITRIAARLVERSAVAKERESIIAAQKLKVYLLTLTSSIVLGLLVSLAPFLSLGSILSSGPAWNPSIIAYSDIMPLYLSLAIISLSSGYQNTLMVSGDRPRVFAVICVLLFWVTSALTSSFIGLDYSWQ